MIFSKLKNVLFVSIILVMILSGCVSDRDTSHYVKTSYSPEDMPKIVFNCRTDYSEIAERDEIQSEITFYDNKGNIYFTSDVYVCDMNYEERNKAFAEGKFEDKLVLIGTCDAAELFENYKKLCKIGENGEYELIYPSDSISDPSVRYRWAGIYYTRDSVLEYVVLREEDKYTNYEANDERATQIYEWFEENMNYDFRNY